MAAILSFDQVKMRRSHYWSIVFFFPLFFILIDFLLLLFNFADVRRDVTQGNSYTVWGSMWMIVYYSHFVAVHLFVTLMASIIANMEHQANVWKLIFSMPVSKVAFYWTRGMWLAVGILLSALLMLVGFWVVGISFGGSDSLNWVRLFSFTVFPYLVSFPLMAVQLWLSMVIKNQSISIIGGVLGVIIGLSTVSSPSWMMFAPWTLPYRVTLSEANQVDEFRTMIETPQLEWELLGVSLLIGLLLCALGSIHFTKKDVS